MVGLFGNEFDIDISKQDIKELVKKSKAATDKEEEVDADKLLKSKKLSLAERLSIISEKVLRVSGG